VLDLDERPKPIEIDRGASVVLTINLGRTRVSAAAVTLQPTAVGSVALFRVVKTRKTIRAKLLSPSTAEVVSE
jgi:flagella basal body P-ring formation protein FlgA